MPVELKKTVFNTGPDDKLRAVDVYSPGEVKRASESEGSQPAPAPTSPLAVAAQVGMSALKAAMLEPTSPPPIDDALGLGLTVGQLTNLVDGFLPPAVDTSAMLHTFSDMPLTEVNGAIDNLQRMTSHTDLKSMNHGEVITAIAEFLQPVRTGQVKTVNDIPDSDLSLLLKGAEIISNIGHKSPTDIMLDIAQSIPTQSQQDYTCGRVANAGSYSGDIAMVATAVGTMGRSLTPNERRSLVNRSMTNYQKPPDLKKKLYTETAIELIDQLTSVDRSWLYYQRGTGMVLNLQNLRNASQDLLKVWSKHPDIGPICAMLRQREPIPTRSSRELIKTQYQYMKV